MCNVSSSRLRQSRQLALNFACASQDLVLVTLFVAMAVCAADVPAMVESLAQASKTLTKTETRNLDQLCEAGKETLAIGFKALIADAAGRPVLTTKSADATPISVVKRIASSLPSGSRVVRRGREKHEYIVKNQLGRFVDSDGQCHTRALIQDPIPLEHGKSVAQTLQVCRKTGWVTLRQMGHVGIAVEHYVFDRFGIKTWEQLLHGWHAVLAIQYDDLSPEIPVNVFRDMEWVVVTGCGAHDAHNALKWSFFHAFENKDMLRDAYVCVASLRNSMDLIGKYLAEWVRSKMGFQDPAPPEWCQSMRGLWLCLDVDPETTELLAFDLQLEFRDDCLFVSRDWACKPDVVGAIAGALLSVWKFTPFTESRWLTIGRSSRSMVAARLCGIESLVKFIARAPGASMYYLKGYARLQGETLQFMVEAALASRVSDAALDIMLGDPRVVRTYDRLWRELSEEMHWLATLEQPVWELLAGVAGVPWGTLRTRTVMAGHTTFHFFWRRVLWPASQLPWSLARGNIEENIDELVAGPMPDEIVSAKIWRLLRAGVARAMVRQGVELLGDIPWTTTMCEQQHGSLAALARFHPEYETTTLTSRAFLMQLRRLLPKASKEEQQLARLNAAIQKLSAKRPESAGGRQLFFQGSDGAGHWAESPVGGRAPPECCHVKARVLMASSVGR